MTKRQRDDKYENEVRYFLNPESVSVHLFCSICQDVFQDPQRAPCGHSFCRKCILPWLRQSKSCPEDRKPVNEKQLHHDFILENIIGDQMVR
ncbi:RING finger protein 151-like [Saccostrea cucullata]|uniref:RING finger protein 151-like n=1 Tax=Saccostrea cuccullata TaxID=36930 RepID=UPI002ED697FD